MIIILNFLDSEILYKKIDKIRVEKGLSIYAMANKACVNPATIYKWRDTKSSPSLYLIESLCDVLEIDIVNLFIKNDELVYLSKDEKIIFEQWKSLSVDQKNIVAKLISSLLKDKKK